MANALRQINAAGHAWGAGPQAEETLSKALVDFLLRPTVYPDRPSRMDLVETHELNRRVAPDVYLGVLAVTIDRKGRIIIGGSGQSID